jgi:periplasmic protein TonB
MDRVTYCLAISTLFIATGTAAQYAASRPIPRGNLSSWLDVEAVPPAMLKKLKKKKIITRFTLSVGVDGRVTGCTHDGRKKLEKEFGELTCRQLIRRARFSPAKDAQGSPVIGSYSNVATWEVPEETGLR